MKPTGSLRLRRESWLWHRRSPGSSGRYSVRGPAFPAWMVVVAGSGLLALTLLVGACSSSSHASVALLGSKTQQNCTAVTDVLADGPDPDADPIGYAEAQVLPLEQLKISDPALRIAVKNLSASFGVYSSATGAAQHEDAALVTKAEGAINAVCPGAAS
jgi:hypothetical protein